MGGAGFIGSHLSEKLSSLGRKVVIVDNFSTSTPIKNTQIYNIGVDDKDAIDKVFKKEKPDFVYHLAGVINLRRNITDPLFIKDSNFLIRIKIILDACKKNNVKKFIFVSSSGVYENATVIPTPEDYPVHPKSLYALASLMVEKYIELYCQNLKLNYVLPRLSNLYGERQWESGIIPFLIIKILHNDRPVIFGKGDQTRDFIYIDDVVEALVLLSQKGKNGVYNVGSGKEVNLNEIFIIVRKLIRSSVLAIYKDLEKEESKRSSLDIKKIKKEIGWQAKVSIKEGLAKTIEWYQAK